MTPTRPHKGHVTIDRDFVFAESALRVARTG